MTVRKPTAAAPVTKRLFRAQQVTMHDLYVLSEEKMLKNVALEGSEPDYMKLNHVHFFHSVDAKGAKQTRCTPIGGHFHEMEVVTPAHGDEPAVLRAGPAKKFVLDPRTKQRIVAAYDAQDAHTHEVVYRSSEEFKPRKMNSEAMRLISQVDHAPEQLPGVIG